MDIELLSRHTAIDQAILADVSAGMYAFPAWLGVQLFESLAAMVMRGPAPASALSVFRIDLADDAGGTVNVTPGPALTTPGNINVFGEWALIECLAADLYAKLASARYCNVFVNSAAAVPVFVTLIRHNPRYAHPAMTTPTEFAWT